MPDWVLVVAGLVVLGVGAEVLVRGATTIASRLGISSMLIGLTVVSIGTSLPELAVGIDAALNDAGPLAIGNIAGTNIVNILLILGLSAAMVPLALSRQTIRFDLPAMAFCAVLLVVLSLSGELTRMDGVILLAIAVIYTIVIVRIGLGAGSSATDTGAVVDDGGPRTWVAAVQLLGGIAAVIIAADWLVDGSIGIATELGVSEELIGLTIVAIGTSAPELMTTIVSTIRGNRDMAIGNLIGSSVYNITFILGASALVAPLAVTSDLIRIDLPLMAVVALICIPVFITGRRVSRMEGIVFVLAYLAYLVFLIALRT